MEKLIETYKYNGLVDEVYGLMDTSRLESIDEMKRSSQRVDVFQDVLRGALLSSSVSIFNGSPYFFGGRIYELMTWDDFGNLVYDLMRKCCLPDGDYSRVDSVIRVCKRIVSGKRLYPDNSLVVFNNCVFDTKTKKAHKFGREWVQVTEVPYKYDPDEVTFMWNQFLDAVLPKNIQDVLQEYIGSIFIDRKEAKMETMLILKGSGSNGKSVVFETIMGLLGRDNVSNFGISSLISGSERKKNIAFINGKRLNYCSEIQAIEFGRESDVLKSLISGEPMEARPLYGDNFTAYNIPLLMANANQLPQLKDSSYGMRRRICILPFEIEIEESRQDKGLVRKLEDEYPAIFNWVMKGRDRFVRNGYKLSSTPTLEKIMDEYQSESSSVLKFMFDSGYTCRIQDLTDVDPIWIQASKLYRKYEIWCRDNSEVRENIQNFGNILSSAGYKKKRNIDGNYYALYGKMIEKRMRNQRLKLEKIKVGKYGQKIVPFERDGKMWVETYEAASKALGMGYARLKSFIDKGVLNGLYYINDRTTTFDITGCELKLREIGAIGVSKSMKLAEVEELYRKSDMRKRFNAKMIKLCLPFRKYAEDNSGNPDVIHVPDDFVYRKDSKEQKKMLHAFDMKQLSRVKQERKRQAEENHQRELERWRRQNEKKKAEREKLKKKVTFSDEHKDETENYEQEQWDD